MIDKLELVAWLNLCGLAVIALGLAMIIIFLLGPPLSSGTGTVTLSDDVIVNKTTVKRLNTNLDYLDERATGSYEGHMWPDRIPEDEPVVLQVSMDRSGYDVMRTCTHEMWHYRLEKAGKPPVTHHKLMKERGILPIRPWDWHLPCVKLFL